MSYNTETAMRHAPGMIFSCLDNGDMILDRNSGEFLPADQVLKDPLHREQLNCMDEDKFGGLKFGLIDMSDDADDEPPGDEHEDDDPVEQFLSEQEELTLLIAAQAADLELDNRYLVDVDEEALPAVTCTKGRHPEYGEEKPDNRWRGASHGTRGRQLYKDRRLRAKGSGKTAASYTNW